MPPGTNDCIPFYSPGGTLSATVITNPVIGKRFVKIAANKEAGPALNTSSSGGNFQVTAIAAGGTTAFGVASYDGAVGEKLTIYTDGYVVPVTAGAAIVAGVDLELDSVGRVVTLASGKKVGHALSAAAALGDDCIVHIRL